MAIIPTPNIIVAPASYSDWRQWAEDFIRLFAVEQAVLRAVVNGALTFGDATDPGNFAIAWLKDQVTNATPDTDTTYNHNIGRAPFGVLLVLQDKAASIYKGAGAWSTTTLTLKANVASVTFTGMVLAAPGDQ